MSADATSGASPHSGLRRIRLELAREPGHPQGSQQDGYILIAPLDRNGRLDAAAWRAQRNACPVTRFRSGATEDIGRLVHRGARGWAFHYDLSGSEDDEAGYRFADERFVPGEYVSIHQADATHTYRVVTVEPV